MPDITCTANVFIEKASDTYPEGCIVVTPRFLNVPEGCADFAVAYSLGAPTPKRLELADRLVAACKAGKVFTGLKVAKRRDGSAYVSIGDYAVHGKTIFADVRGLGF